MADLLPQGGGTTSLLRATSRKGSAGSARDFLGTPITKGADIVYAGSNISRLNRATVIEVRENGVIKARTEAGAVVLLHYPKRVLVQPRRKA